MNFDTTTISNTVDHGTVRSVAKILLGIPALIFLVWLVSLLPGIDRLLPRTAISIWAILGAVVTVVLVALLVSVAPKLASLTRQALDGPPDVVENLASIVLWGVILVAVLVAHGGLAGVIVPLLGGISWIYDVTFLLLSVPPVFGIAARLFDSLDPGADLVADVIVGESDPETASGTNETSEDAGSGSTRTR